MTLQCNNCQNRDVDSEAMLQNNREFRVRKNHSLLGFVGSTTSLILAKPTSSSSQNPITKIGEKVKQWYLSIYVVEVLRIKVKEKNPSQWSPSLATISPHPSALERFWKLHSPGTYPFSLCLLNSCYGFWWSSKTPWWILIAARLETPSDLRATLDTNGRWTEDSLLGSGVIVLLAYPKFISTAFIATLESLEHLA